MKHLHHLPEKYRLEETMPRTTACGSLAISNVGDGEKVAFALGPEAGDHSLTPDCEEPSRSLVEEGVDALEETRFSPEGRFLRPDERPLRAEFLDKVTGAGFCHRCVLATAARRTWPEEPERLGQEELKSFTIGLAEGRVFTSSHLRSQNDIMSVFMPLALMRRLPPDDYFEKVGVIWQWTDRSGPTAINGMPVFFSCRFMHIEDWSRAVAAAKRITDMQNDLVV